jgi:predicted ArsR family transcriptional regulator
VEHGGDRQFLELLRRRGRMTVHSLVRESGVTATAVRQRLNRLMREGLVQRSEQREGRGRPHHSYSLTERAHAMLGQNYANLAKALWQELNRLADRAVGMKVLRRAADRLAQGYRRHRLGQAARERLGDLRDLLSEQGIDVEVDETGALPVLRQHSCPYHELAELDRTICDIELRMFEKALDCDVKLSQCRLDGHCCCEFEVRRRSRATRSGGSPTKCAPTATQRAH